MRLIFLATIMIFISCNTKEKSGTITKTDTLITTVATTAVEQKPTAKKDTILQLKTYGNKRFRNVIVERIGKDSFLVHGQGQIFEANFNWVLEDGHDELQKGFQMTDAGAPEWGKFNFIIKSQKKRKNSTLTLIIFETSAKDGSREYELPIVLY